MARTASSLTTSRFLYHRQDWKSSRHLAKILVSRLRTRLHHWVKLRQATFIRQGQSFNALQQFLEFLLQISKICKVFRYLMIVWCFAFHCRPDRADSCVLLCRMKVRLFVFFISAGAPGLSMLECTSSVLWRVEVPLFVHFYICRCVPASVHLFSALSGGSSTICADCICILTLVSCPQTP